MIIPATTDMAGSGNPYVGPRSIAYGESIFGRDTETAELLDTLIAQRIVLLYSPSGAGKSSLLEASLRPELEKRRFQVLPTIRVGQAANHPSGNRYALSTMLSLQEVLDKEHQLDPARLADLELDEFVSWLMREAGDDDRDPCLFFDQFEELFTLDPTDREAKATFLKSLGVLLRDRSLWALFAIREDHIARLDPYLALIPTRFSVHYRLDLLSPEAAKLAARRPAEQAGVRFADEAADRLVDDLRKVNVQRGESVTTELGPHVEPVQLQVVCRRLWAEATR